MDDGRPEAPYLENIGLFLTYKCQVACPHCMVKAGPHRTEAVNEDDALSWIAQAAAYRGRIKSINLTGGEPFFDLPLLRRICAFSLSKGLFPTSVTNAYWAETYDKAVEILESLPELLFLQISADEHHQNFIPFERVRNAVLAARKLDLVCAVAVCTDYEDSPGYREIVDTLSSIMDRERIRTVVTFPAGRASLLIGNAGRAATDIPPAGACASAATPVMYPDGRVLACMGPVFDLRDDHPLLLGNLFEKSLEEILDAAEMNPVLHFIRTWGPSALYAILKENGYEHDVPRTFVAGSICTLCKELMASPALRAGITGLLHDTDFIEAVAYGRSHYLNEQEMTSRIGG